MADEEKPKSDSYAPAMTGGKRKRKVAYHIALAILDVVERKKLNYQVNYRAIGTRHGMTADNLRRTYFEYAHGGIDLGDVGKPMEAAAGDRENHELAREVVRRDLALTLRGYSGALYHAEDSLAGKAPTKKKVQRQDKLAPGSSEMMKDLAYYRNAVAKLLDLQKTIDEGYAAWIEDAAAKLAREKSANPGVPIPAAVVTSISNADERSRVLEQLRLDSKPAEFTPMPQFETAPAEAVTVPKT